MYLDKTLLHQLHLQFDDMPTINLTADNVNNFIFVTAARSKVFNDLKATVAHIQKFMPKYKIYVYDLGLSFFQAYEVSTNLNQLNNLDGTVKTRIILFKYETGKESHTVFTKAVHIEPVQ